MGDEQTFGQALADVLDLISARVTFYREEDATTVADFCAKLRRVSDAESWSEGQEEPAGEGPVPEPETVVEG